MTTMQRYRLERPGSIGDVTRVDAHQHYWNLQRETTLGLRRARQLCTATSRRRIYPVSWLTARWCHGVGAAAATEANALPLRSRPRSRIDCRRRRLGGFCRE